MKFIKLEIKNLASLDRQEGEVIEFEEGALKDSTIFSIVGSTGSGKSTLLDAICLALYNVAPRYPKVKGKRNQNIVIYGDADEGEKNRLAPTDCRNILTRGKKEGYSKLTFLANDGNIYRAEWYVHRKVKNYEAATTNLYKISNQGGKIVEEVAEWDKLPQIIGLEYDQFLRTVLIAQGSFANFLTTNENDRYELLEKLVGCEEQYTRIAAEIKKKKDEADKTYSDICAQSAAYEKDIIPAEELEPLKNRIKELEDEEEKAKKELGKITEALAWFTSEEEFQKNLTTYEQDLNTAQTNLSKIKEDVERLALHDATLPAVEFYKETKAAEKAINTQDNEIEDLTGQIKKQEESQNKAKEALQELEKAKETATQEFEKQKPHINRARIIKGELAIANQGVIEKRKAQTEADAALKEAEKAVILNTQAIENAAKASNQAKEAEAQLKNSIEKEKAEKKSTAQAAIDVYKAEAQKAEGLDAKSLQDAKSAAIQKQNDLLNAIRIQKGIKEGETTLAENADKAKQLTERNNAIAKELEELHIDDLLKELEILKRCQTLMTSENWTEHRSDLADGEPCPLCGAIHHPYKDEQTLAPVVSMYNELIGKKQEELGDKNKKKSTLDTEKGKNEGVLASLSTSTEKQNQNLTTFRKEWNAIHGQYPDWTANVEELSLLKFAIDEEVEKASTSLNNYNDLVKKIGELRDTKEKAEQALNEFKQNADRQIKSAEEAVTNATTALETEKAKTENLNKQQKEKEDALRQAKEAYDKAVKDVTDKKSVIKAEIGENDPDVFEQKLQKAKDDADDAVNLKNKEIGTIREALQGLVGRVDSAKKSKSEAEGKLKDNAKSLAEWLCHYNADHVSAVALTTEDIAQLSIATDDWESIRAEQQRANGAFTAAKTTFENEDKKHKTHQEKKPEEAKEILIARKTELESNTSTELVDSKARMQRHEAAEKSMGSIFEQVQKAKDEKREWEEISDAIGGSDGKILRKIAQCYTLRFLIEHANFEIKKFNSRYELQQVKNSLGIRVIDHDRGDDVRDTTSLSGGETFIVSLGLALGLSALSSKNISFENLFIDEGFGTLDPDTLATVIDSLAMLQSSQGKKVGVISHTDTMSERITTQIRVIKNGNSGSSHIEVYPA